MKALAPIASEAARVRFDMLTFRFTCPRHQRTFVETVRKAGCSDPASMDEIRRLLLAWISARYPRIVLDHFEEGSCLGCEFEAHFGDTSELRGAIEALVKNRGDTET